MKKFKHLGPANDRPAAVTEEWIAAVYASNERDIRRLYGSVSINPNPISFLALEIDRVRRDQPEPPDAWGWDISRPIAGQLTEVAMRDAEARKDEALDIEAWKLNEPVRTAASVILGPIIGAYDPAEDAMRDPAVTAHNAEVVRQHHATYGDAVDEDTPPTDPDTCCTCTGDDLLLERCAS